MVYTGTWLVLATVAVIVILFWLGYYWAKSNGQFDDFETITHTMLENERRYGDDEFYSPDRQSGS
jgi:nitrogen fixation-related uncharacterized protein